MTQIYQKEYWNSKNKAPSLSKLFPPEADVLVLKNFNLPPKGAVKESGVDTPGGKDYIGKEIILWYLTGYMNWSVTDIVAWWGAVLSTIVFAWDVIKWRLAGPQIQMTVNSGMKSFNMPEYEGKLLILAHVVNRGDRSTTLTHFGLMHYTNLWNRLRRRPKTTLWVPNPNLQIRLPHELKPGLTWQGVAVQKDEVEAMARDGRLYCAVYQSHRKRPVKKRVTIKREP